MGNSKSDLDFAIKMDKQFYFAGDKVEGKLFVHAKKDTPCARIVIQIEGIQSCEFQNQQNEIQRGFNKLINTHVILRQYRHNNKINGQYVFPFEFRFLHYLPGSFQENKHGYKASVKYFIKAIIQPSFNHNELLQKKMQITIREPQREGERMLFGQTMASCRSLFCLDKGVSRVSCYFERNYYFPKDDCIMVCEIDSTRCNLDISRVQCRFMKQLKLTAVNSSQKIFTQELNRVDFPGIPATKSYFGDTAERQVIKLNERNSVNGVLPTTRGHHVRCEYYILVEPKFGGCFTKVQDKNFKVKVDILQPARDYQPILVPENWRPSIEQPSSFFLGNRQQNDLLSSTHQDTTGA